MVFSVCICIIDYIFWIALCSSQSACTSGMIFSVTLNTSQEAVIFPSFLSFPPSPPVISLAFLCVCYMLDTTYFKVQLTSQSPLQITGRRVSKESRTGKMALAAAADHSDDRSREARARKPEDDKGTGSSSCYAATGTAWTGKEGGPWAIWGELFCLSTSHA